MRQLTYGGDLDVPFLQNMNVEICFCVDATRLDLGPSTRTANFLLSRRRQQLLPFGTPFRTVSSTWQTRFCHSSCCASLTNWEQSNSVSIFDNNSRGCRWLCVSGLYRCYGMDKEITVIFAGPNKSKVVQP